MAQETIIEESGCQLHEFERNRYFFGKLLTVRDFGVEQRYMNEKRRLLSRLVNGMGILCGLNVSTITGKEGFVDSLEIMPGVALDCCGREVVVPRKANTGNISGLTGYPKNFDGGILYLCLEYDECLREPLPAMTNATSCEETCDYNRIQERYKLVLSEIPPDVSGFLTICSPQVVIYRDTSIEIRRMTPRWVNPGEVFEVKFIITALEDISGMKVKIQEIFTPEAMNQLTLIKGLAPDFVTPELVLTNLNERDTLEHSYFMRADGLIEDSEIDAKIKVDENEFQPAENKSLLSVIEEQVIERVISYNFSETKATCLDCTESSKIYLSKLNVSVNVDGVITDLQADNFLSFDQFVFDNPLLSKLIACGSNRIGKVPLVSVKDSDSPDPKDKLPAVSIFDFRGGLSADADASEQGQANISVNAGTGLEIADDTLQAKLGKGVDFNSSQQIEVQLGRGVLFNASNQVEANLGRGLKFNANEAMEAEVANGIKIVGNKIQPDYSRTNTAKKVCEANDPRLSDNRRPLPHAATHQTGGADEINVKELRGELQDPQKVVVQHDGLDIGKRPILNFAGEGVASIEDDPPNGRINIKIIGGGTAPLVINGEELFKGIKPGETRESPPIDPGMGLPYNVQLAVFVTMPNGSDGYMMGDLQAIFLNIFGEAPPSMAAFVDRGSGLFSIFVTNETDKTRDYRVIWWAIPS